MTQPRVLHLICQAHLDPVWIWPRRDGVSEALTTIASAVRFLREEPDMRFTRSSTAVYQWIAEADPGLFREVQDLMAAGRWEIVNGWVVQPDCNLSLSESFVRQSLYGKSWFEDHFGVDVNIGYNVDSFGHAGGLPQLLRRAGFAYYVFMRPVPAMDGGNLPLLFRWRSDDGSEVLTWRIPQNYGQSPSATADFLEEEIRKAADNNFAPGFQHAAFFVGVGNHGGGPTRRQIDRIRKLQKDTSLPELRFSTMRDFFAAVEAEKEAMEALPIIKTGLQYHAVGCYSAHSRLKRWCRRGERSLLRAEALENAARLAGAPENHNTQKPLRKAWETLLFNQFHDILGGTCLESIDEEIRDDIGSVAQKGDSISSRALHAIARSVDIPDAKGGVLFLMNPLPWERQAEVAFDTFVAPDGGDLITHLKTPEGQSEPIQWEASEACFGPMGMEWKKLHASVKLPPLGYNTFYLATGKAPRVTTKQRKDLKVSKTELGIDFMGVRERENLLTAPIGLEVLPDVSDTWGHRTKRYEGNIGSPTLVDTQTLANGPVVTIIRQRATWNRSEIVLYIKYWRQRREIELAFRLNWQEERQILRLVIPTVFNGKDTYAGEPGGCSVRVSDGDEKPANEWLAIAGRVKGRPRAIGLAGDRAFSHTCSDGCIRIMLARSGFYAHHFPRSPRDAVENPYLDYGILERRFRLTCATGGTEALQLHRLAWEIDNGAERVVDSAHPGHLPSTQSLLEISPSSVALHAIKESEDGESLIVRIQELTGKPVEAKVSAPTLRTKDWSGLLEPWEIRTLAIPLRDRRRAVRSLDLLERESSS